MGAQEVAAAIAILTATPAAAIYSVARWDASRFLIAPETKKDMEEDTTKKKPTRLQECLRFLCFLAFMAACWGAGWSLQYLPAVMRDAGILLLMCGFPVISSTYGGGVLFGTANEVFRIEEVEGKSVLRGDTVRRTCSQRALTASVGALVLSCTYYRTGYTAIMILIGSGMMFSSSLLMGLETTKASLPLWTSAKWYSIIAGTVVTVAYGLPPLIDWLLPKFKKHSTETPARAESSITAWTDSATQIYAIVCAAMWGSITCGVLLSRLYRIDAANARRKNITTALNPAVRPRYLQDASLKSSSTASDATTSYASTPAIKVMSPLEMLMSGSLRELVYGPWYSGLAYACMALMLIFAMPTILSIFPMMEVIKKEAIQSGAQWDNSTWLSSSICVAIYASTYLGLLPIPMLLSVGILAAIRGESGFVWRETFNWAPFGSSVEPDSPFTEK